MSALQKTRLSTKGQVILPKAMRDRKGWRPGAELMVEETPEGILFKAAPAPLFEATRLEDVFGILHRPGMRALSIEEMDAAVLEGVADRYRRSFDAGD